jgi:hypothetical protein
MRKIDDENAEWFDRDIAALELGYGEKAGLQIYRNYTRSFEKHAIEKFIEVLDREPLELHEFDGFVARIVTEDGRYLPVIVSAFADDLLKKAFDAVLPDGIPGGKKSMLGGYGPLSDFAKRIQLGYAFDVLSKDLLADLDKVRSVRNQIAHSWQVTDLSQFFEGGRLADIHPVEELLGEREDLKELKRAFDSLTAFRIRMVWIMGRLVYEVAAFHRAKEARLDPHKALYGKPSPKWLVEIGRITLEATRRIADCAEAGR